MEFGEFSVVGGVGYLGTETKAYSVMKLSDVGIICADEAT